MTGGATLSGAAGFLETGATQNFRETTLTSRRAYCGSAH